MDRYWYHELLRGAVSHGLDLENALKNNIAVMGLTNKIRETSHASLNKSAGSKLNWFYLTVLLIQVIGLVLLLIQALCKS